MINKTIEINVSPETALSESNKAAGVMCEHNATELKFILSNEYMDSSYKYYLEFISAVTGPMRTEYLALNGSEVSFSIPAEISSLLTVDCYLNIVKVINGITEMLIKPVRIQLDFSKIFDANNEMLSNYDFSINALLEAIKNDTFKGSKGDTGEKGGKGDKGDKGDKGEPALPIDAEMSSTSTNAVQNKAIKKYVDGIRETIIVNTPPFTIQPTIEGSLNAVFKPWNEDYYYVHKIDDNSFTLMPNKDDASNAIGQIFTLSGLNTGNSGTLIENDPIDFLTTGASFSMRKAGVRSFSFSNLNCNQIEFYGNGYCNSSGYFMIDTINGFNSYDFNYFGTVGKYIGGQGFVIGINEFKVKNVQNNFNLKLNANKKHLNLIYNIHNYRCDDVDKTKIISHKNTAGNGSGFKTDLSDIAQVFTSININTSYPGIFRNGFELTVIKRSV